MDALKSTYLGDGVYAQFDGFHVILTTSDGINLPNVIYLDDRVMSSLIRYSERIDEMRRQAAKPQE